MKIRNCYTAIQNLEVIFTKQHDYSFVNYNNDNNK